MLFRMSVSFKFSFLQHVTTDVIVICLMIRLLKECGIAGFTLVIAISLVASPFSPVMWFIKSECARVLLSIFTIVR